MKQLRFLTDDSYSEDIRMRAKEFRSELIDANSQIIDELFMLWKLLCQSGCSVTGTDGEPHEAEMFDLIAKLKQSQSNMLAVLSELPRMVAATESNESHQNE